MTDSFAITPTTGAGLQDWGVLTVEQEIRARALDTATRLGIRPESPDPGDEAAAVAAVVECAARLVRFLTDGRPCTCLTDPGEHPHTARGCDIEHCACRWVPPPIDEAWEATNGQLRYVDGYREAISRLRDDERYARAPEHLRRWNADVRKGLADYLEQYYAPDPSDPWADAAEERSDDPSKASDLGEVS